MKKGSVVLALLWLAVLPPAVQAQEEGATASAAAHDSAAQANNPLANFTALNFQNYYIGELTEPDNDANQFWVRYAQPFSIGTTNWIFRASLPVNSFPVAPNQETKTGLGDFNAFAAYLIDTGDPAVSFGIGPQLTAPTATEDQLGSEKWSAGLANVLFNASFEKRVGWARPASGGQGRAQPGAANP